MSKMKPAAVAEPIGLVKLLIASILQFERRRSASSPQQLFAKPALFHCVDLFVNPDRFFDCGAASFRLEVSFLILASAGVWLDKPELDRGKFESCMAKLREVAKRPEASSSYRVRATISYMEHLRKTAWGALSPNLVAHVSFANIDFDQLEALSFKVCVVCFISLVGARAAPTERALELIDASAFISLCYSSFCSKNNISQ